jgi:serine/threonine-protein kinase mTOR
MQVNYFSRLNKGLIGWVANTNTLHGVIKNYRENRNINLNLEYIMRKNESPEYDSLTLFQKLEVFNYLQENTSGQDLYKILWLQSRSSEIWLERRTNFTRSLAVMSIVGYILGLGDRHPRNLMIEENIGKIVHVGKKIFDLSSDFGDCFEVAMNREHFPEKVPFRLTRMLINAMVIREKLIHE